MSEEVEKKVSSNARVIILSIVWSVAGVSGFVAVASIFTGNVDTAEKVSLSLISGLIGFGAGIVTALWGK